MSNVMIAFWWSERFA